MDVISKRWPQSPAPLPFTRKPEASVVHSSSRAGVIELLILGQSRMERSWKPSAGGSLPSMVCATAICKSCSIPASINRSNAVVNRQLSLESSRQNHKDKRWVCSRSGSTRDLPTIALLRAGTLLRRNGPVGILAAHRPGAIVDKSRRRFVIRLDAMMGSTRKAPTKTSITLPFQDSSRKNKNSNHCSAEDAKFGNGFKFGVMAMAERCVTLPESAGKLRTSNSKPRKGDSPQRRREHKGRNGFKFGVMEMVSDL